MSEPIVRIIELPYTCRVCAGRTNLHVEPRMADDGGLEITDNYHRVVKADCSECGQMRTQVLDWVAAIDQYIEEGE